MVKILGKNSKLYRLLTILLVAVTAFGAIFGIYKLVEKSKEKTKVIRPSYSIGALSEQGDYVENKQSLYTKEAFDCKGLKIETDFDSNITYEVFFYDKDGNFVSKTEAQTKNYSTVPETAVMARISIAPVKPDKDFEFTFFNKYKYSNQLKITVDKDQTIDEAE